MSFTGIIPPSIMNPVSLAAWCAALFLATNLFSHTVALRLAVLSLGCVLAAVALSRKRFAGQYTDVSFLPPLALPFALWGAWAALSVTWSLEPDRSMKEFRNEIVYASAAFWLCYVGAQAQHAVRTVLPVMALGALAVCTVSIFSVWIEPGSVAAAAHSGPGTHSSTLLVLFPCTLTALWFTARTTRNRAIVAAAIGLILLYLVSGYATLNRTLWVGFAVQLLIVGRMLLGRGAIGTAPGRRAWTWAAVTLLVVAGSAAILMKVQGERDTSGGASITSDPRRALWSSVIEKIEARPLTGIGFGRGILRGELRDQFENPQLWHSHNLFLESALQVGLVGLALLMLLIGWTIRLGWQMARAPDEVAAACGVALLAVVAGTLVRNMTDVLWVRQAALLYWGTTGILLGLGMRRNGSAA